MNLIICIPTYNRNESLLNCLRSINNIIIYDKIKITALIVDNTKNNNSKNIINKNRQKFRFPIIHKNEKRRGIVFARNKCLHNLKKINPDFAAFVDDDCAVDKFWLKNIIQTIFKTNADIVTGPQIYRKSNNSKKINLALFFEKKVKKKISKVNWAASNNVFIKFNKINFKGLIFDKKLNRFGIGEDQLFFSLLNDKGYNIYWNKKIKVYEKTHEHRQQINWLINRSYKLGVLGHYIDIKLNGIIIGILINYLKSLFYLLKSIYFLTLIFNKNYKIDFLNYFSRSYGRLIGIFVMNKIKFYK